MRLLLLHTLAKDQRFWGKHGGTKYTLFSEDGLASDLWVVYKKRATSKQYYNTEIPYWWMEFKI